MRRTGRAAGPLQPDGIAGGVTPTDLPGRPSLTDSARAVFRRLAGGEPATMPALSGLLGFSKPTMSAAVAELTRLRLIGPVGVTEGLAGRKAKLYGLVPDAGHVIGVDAGSTQVRAMAQTLAGHILAEAAEPAAQLRRPLGPETCDAVLRVLRTVRDSLGSQGRLRTIAVACPVIVSPERPGLARDAELDALAGVLRAISCVPVLLENNVNCGAIAEMRDGAARGRTSFAYLQIGVKIGLGLVSGGLLFRGFNGAAGEASRLPFPWSGTGSPNRNGLEHYLGSDGLICRVGKGWPVAEGPAPATARDLFERAAAGSAAASAAVARHGTDIGKLAAAVVALVDPGLIVLGGGVGQNASLTDPVDRMVRKLTWPTDVISGELGSRGSVLGATYLATRAALGQIAGFENNEPLGRPHPDVRFL